MPEEHTVSALVKWVGGIVATIVSGLVLWYVTHEPKSLPPPAKVELLTYDDYLGHFYLTYPGFLEGAQGFSKGEARGVMLGNVPSARDSTVIGAAKLAMDPNFLIVSVEPRPPSLSTEELTKLLLAKLNRFQSTTSSWVGYEQVLSTRRDGLSFYVEKKRAARLHVSDDLYVVELFRIEERSLVSATGMFSEERWSLYKDQIRASFQSIGTGLRKPNAEKNSQH